MSPTDAYHFLVEVIRDGAGSLAALLIGGLGGLALGRWLWVRRARARYERLRMVNQHLTAENRQLIAEEAERKKEVGTLEAKVAVLQQEKQRSAADLTRAEMENGLLRAAKTRLGEQIEDLQSALEDREATSQRLQAEGRRLRDQNTALESENGRLTATLLTRDQELAELRERCESLIREHVERDAELTETRQALTKAEARARKVRKRLRAFRLHTEKLLNQQGKIWELPVPKDAPAYRHLAERRAVVIAVLNFKGGVGKTTISLNLGVTLAARPPGTRVLFVDLDYQRSLSSLCLPRDQLRRLSSERHCLQYCLADPQGDPKRFLECLAPLSNAPGCSVVITSQPDPQTGEPRLDDVENQMLTAWMSRPDVQDIRFRLRRPLQAPEIADQFDYILLDCPPRLSPACVNALVAADFLIVPVHLDWAALVAIPQLLRELKVLKANGILAHLNILGLVANKTHGASLTKHEQEIWNKLDLRCQAAEVWKPNVRFFSPFIPQRACFGRVATDFREATDLALAVQEDPDVAAVFQKLANEVKERVRNECRRRATVSP
jgi:cellulose biosynthesis protein BcsQ